VIRKRAHASRVLAPALFLLAAASFFLPFLTIEQERVGTATGLELVRGEPEYSGRYVHAAYEGEVERRLDRGRVPAVIGFAAAVAGIVVSVSAAHPARIAAFAAASVGFLAVASILQTTSSPFGGADRHEGIWLAIGLLLAAGVISAVRAWTRPPIPEDDDDGEPPPWRRV
jgi:hypothetical protein